MTFDEQSEIHEIPPKPKRTPRLEKRSRSAPGPIQSKLRRKFIDPLISIEDKASTNDKTDKNLSTVDGKSSAIVIEQFQRASVTSLEDLIGSNDVRQRGSSNDDRQKSSNKRISESDIVALNKVPLFLVCFCLLSRVFCACVTLHLALKVITWVQ